MMLMFMVLLFILRSDEASSDDDDWSKDIVPKNYSGTSTATDVYVHWELETKGIIKLSALDMEFSADLRLRIAWTDNQLTIKYDDYKVLTKNIMQKIFFPYLEFTNCKACHPLMTDPEKFTFVLNRKEIIHKFRFCFTYKYVFERAVLQHLLVTFVPSILIVILSWISFWLDADLAAPRVALGQTSLLTLAAQFNNAQRNLPSASNVKALDIWMFVCIFLAFASIVEFALAYNFREIRKIAPQNGQISSLVIRNNNVEMTRKVRGTPTT
uniref:Neurotransmitter-gated ion-channel transmembrane domain-containing protein n=1 Tax=Strigamia maritima TaxID=126957 RepID=T1JD83_STRMM